MGGGHPQRKSKSMRARFKSNLRHSKRFRAKKIKLREEVGVLTRKHALDCALLNADGLTESTLVDIKDTLDDQKCDILFVLETKRGEEEVGSDISVTGYSVREVRRSDVAGDKGGGGIAVYTRDLDNVTIATLFF